MPTLIVEFFWDALRLVGLVNKVYYRGRAGAIRESLGLPVLPYGYRELAEYVMAGDLSDQALRYHLVEELWQGIA